MAKNHTKKELWVVEEWFALGSWTAVDGDGKGNLVPFDSAREAEKNLEFTIREFQENGLEGYAYPSDDFRVRPLTKHTRLRDGLRLTGEQEAFLLARPSNNNHGDETRK